MGSNHDERQQEMFRRLKKAGLKAAHLEDCFGVVEGTAYRYMSGDITLTFAQACRLMRELPAELGSIIASEFVRNSDFAIISLADDSGVCIDESAAELLETLAHLIRQRVKDLIDGEVSPEEHQRQQELIDSCVQLVAQVKRRIDSQKVTKRTKARQPRLAAAG